MKPEFFTARDTKGERQTKLSPNFLEKPYLTAAPTVAYDCPSRYLGPFASLAPLTARDFSHD